MWREHLQVCRDIAVAWRRPAVVVLDATLIAYIAFYEITAGPFRSGVSALVALLVVAAAIVLTRVVVSKMILRRSVGGSLLVAGILRLREWTSRHLNGATFIVGYLALAALSGASFVFADKWEPKTRTIAVERSHFQSRITSIEDAVFPMLLWADVSDPDIYRPLVRSAVQIWALDDRAAETWASIKPGTVIRRGGVPVGQYATAKSLEERAAKDAAALVRQAREVARSRAGTVDDDIVMLLWREREALQVRLSIYDSRYIDAAYSIENFLRANLWRILAALALLSIPILIVFVAGEMKSWYRE